MAAQLTVLCLFVLPDMWCARIQHGHIQERAVEVLQWGGQAEPWAADLDAGFWDDLFFISNYKRL